MTLPFQEGAPGGRSGKGIMRGPFGGTLAVRARSVVVALALLGVGRGRSFGEGVCHAPPKRTSSWLSFGTLYSRSAVFFISMRPISE